MASTKPRKTKADDATDAAAAHLAVAAKKSAKVVKTAPPAEAAKPATTPAKKPAQEPSAPKGRAPLDGKFTINAENLERVKRGFTFEFLGKAQDLNKVSRGKGFQLSALFAEFPDKGRGQLMDCFYACTERGIFVPA